MKRAHEDRSWRMWRVWAERERTGTWRGLNLLRLFQKRIDSLSRASATLHVHPEPLQSPGFSVGAEKKGNGKKREREKESRGREGGCEEGRQRKDERDTFVAVRMGEISRCWQCYISQISVRTGGREYTLWILWMPSFMYHSIWTQTSREVSEKAFSDEWGLWWDTIWVCVVMLNVRRGVFTCSCAFMVHRSVVKVCVCRAFRSGFQLIQGKWN